MIDKDDGMRYHNASWCGKGHEAFEVGTLSTAANTY